MVKVFIKQVGEECYLDGYMQSNLDELRKAVALDWDGVILYTGNEGDGKTTKCSQDLAYLDPTFNLSRVCFTLQQVKELVPKLKPGQALQYDESRKDTNAGDNTVTLREFIRIMTENRDKRLYWGIVSATFFDLKKYFAIHRTRVLINVYANGLERGFFSFYDREKKKNLYIKGKKEWNWSVETPNFRGRFTSWLPFDKDAYKRKKRESTIGDGEDTELLNDPVVVRAIGKRVDEFAQYLQRNNWIKSNTGSYNQAIADFLGISTRSLYNYRKEVSFAHEQARIGGSGSVLGPHSHQETNDDNLEESRELDSGDEV